MINMEENNEVSARDNKTMSGEHTCLNREKEALDAKNEERNDTNIHLIEKAIDIIKINGNNDNEKASIEKHFRHEKTKKEEILETNKDDLLTLEVDNNAPVNKVDLERMRRELTEYQFDDSKINKEKNEHIGVTEDVSDEAEVNVEVEIIKEIYDEVNINKAQPLIHLNNGNKEDFDVKDDMLEGHFEDDMKMNEKAILNGKIDADINYENTRVNEPIKQFDMDIDGTKMNTEKAYKMEEFTDDGLGLDINSYDGDEDEDYKTETVNYRKLILMNMLSCINVEEYMPIFELV